MSWFLAFAGFAVLIILHEFGHFAAAKSVGMRVERFSLFFPPKLIGIKRGETEYAIGAIPLGGYVRITGMVPGEEMPPEVEHRAYYNQPIWKRIVVIAAGPAMNVLVAFLLLLVFYTMVGPDRVVPVVGSTDAKFAAATSLRAGDRFVSVDGKSGTAAEFRQRVLAHRCAGRPVAGCKAKVPVDVVVVRNGQRTALRLTPQFDQKSKIMRLGVVWGTQRAPQAPFTALSSSVSEMWFLTKQTVSLPARVFDAEKRKEISGTVGAYEVTRQTINFRAEDAIFILALISLSLAIINLFPFLPLDGGHIFWALVEGLRGRPASMAAMERASAVGFALVIGLFLIGFTNDMQRLGNGGFGP